MKLEHYFTGKVEFDEANHLYIVNGEPKPGPSQIIGMVGLSKPVDDMPEPMRSNFIAAGNLGKVVHKWCEIDDLGQKHLYEEIPPRIEYYLQGWRKFKKDFEVEMLEIEQPHYSEYGDYCGIPDRAALVKKFPYVIDIKSSKSMNPNGRLQTMGYTYFFKNPLRRMLVQLKDDGNYKIYDDGLYGKEFVNDSIDRDNWEAALRISHLIRLQK